VAIGVRSENLGGSRPEGHDLSADVRERDPEVSGTVDCFLPEAGMRLDVDRRWMTAAWTRAYGRAFADAKALPIFVRLTPMPAFFVPYRHIRYMIDELRGRKGYRASAP
jgi:hypothetical protein